jgi:hypothetical protein
MAMGVLTVYFTVSDTSDANQTTNTLVDNEFVQLMMQK